MNDLLQELGRTQVCLKLGHRDGNNFNHANGMVLLSPSKGVRKLLFVYELYTKNHELVDNAKKTELMVFTSSKSSAQRPSGMDRSSDC